MINDYKFRSDQTFGTPLRRLRRVKLFMLSVGVVAAGYATIHYSGQQGNTAHQVTQSRTQGIPAAEELQIPLALPSEAESESAADTDSISTTPKNRSQPSEPLLMDEYVPSPGTDSEPFAQSAKADEQPSDFYIKEETEDESPQDAFPETAKVEEAARIPPKPGPEAAADEPTAEMADNLPEWKEERVKKGDSLARIFSRLGLSANLLHRIVNSGPKAKQLARIRPGEKIRVGVDDQGGFVGLIHQRNAIESLQVSPLGDGFEARLIERGLEKRVAQTSGTITNSLYQGAQRAGLSDELTMELANIFGWDIDFALEIRAGDHFSLVYEEQYLDGELFDDGPILAAEFVNRGKVFRAIRYEDEQGNSHYFSPDGHSMRKAFLRAPVDFRRISSRFTKARWHPVLGKKRPHKGVDYAAATGTPIKAAGDGRVIFRGNKGGYGKAVIIKHGQKYTTLYGHMSKFKSSVKNGSRVKQGQTIGYVGKSGLATGPHLHYEFRVNGVHRNPLTIKLPAAAPIDKRYRNDFKTKSAPLLAQLDLMSETVLAKAQ